MAALELSVTTINQRDAVYYPTTTAGTYITLRYIGSVWLNYMLGLAMVHVE